VVTAGPVTIDLAGFSIRGFGGVGIRGASTVRNGSIVGFGIGVEASIVEGLHVFGGCGRPCAYGISGTIVKGNVVSNVSAVGITATGVITGNYVFNSDTGFVIGEGSTVIGNTATQSFHTGFFVNCPSNVTNNTVVNNGTNLC
jgi:hypothetical protein